MTEYALTYLSLGAGVQSSAMLVCSALGLHGVPRADVAIFADTQQEPRHVYEQVERLSAWAEPYGIPVEVVSEGDLLADAVGRIDGTKSRFSCIPMFVVGRDGRAAPGRRNCTRDYKVNPIERRVREILGYEPRQRIREKALCLVGISADEIYRVKPSWTRWIDRAHPLVDARLRRGDCVRIVEEAGLPRPKRSACVFCPYTNDARWAEMQRDTPEEFEAACRADEALRDQSSSGMRSSSFVHRSLVPLREIDFQKLDADRNAMPLFDGFEEECEGMCGV